MRVTPAPDCPLHTPMEHLFYGLCCFHEIPVERVMLGATAQTDGPLHYWPAFRVAVPKMLEVNAEIADKDTDAALRPYRKAWRARAGGRGLVVLYRDELDTLREAARPAQFTARLRMIDNQRPFDAKPW
jgi:hypothetical protein